MIDKYHKVKPGVLLEYVDANHREFRFVLATDHNNPTAALVVSPAGLKLVNYVPGWAPSYANWIKHE